MTFSLTSRATILLKSAIFSCVKTTSSVMTSNNNYLAEAKHQSCTLDSHPLEVSMPMRPMERIQSVLLQWEYRVVWEGIWIFLLWNLFSAHRWTWRSSPLRSWSFPDIDETWATCACRTLHNFCNQCFLGHWLIILISQAIPLEAIKTRSDVFHRVLVLGEKIYLYKNNNGKNYMRYKWRVDSGSGIGTISGYYAEEAKTGGVRIFPTSHN